MEDQKLAEIVEPNTASPAQIEEAECLLVVDLEATCDQANRLPADEMETIEIGAVLVDLTTMQPSDEFQSFIKPIRHPQLTPFCTKLTSISQDMVDSGPSFPVAFEMMKDRLLKINGKTIFGSWGAYDRTQFIRDCALHNVDYDLPPHLNLKNALSQRQGWRKRHGMARALKMCGIPLEGQHHRGIDDARNIARLLPWILGDRKL